MKNIDLSYFNNKDLGELIKYGDELFNSKIEDKIHAHKVYVTVLNQLPRIFEFPFPKLRGIVRQKIWNCEKFFHWNENFFSQCGQDKIIKEYFFNNLTDDSNKRYFVEIGSFDGVTGSNCYHFEKFCKWDGVAIEPSKIQFQKLLKNRNCKIINSAIDKVEHEIEFFEVVEGYTQMSYLKNENDNYIRDTLNKDKRTRINKQIIQTVIFNKIIKNKEIDYLSIDTEGNELDILKSIDFEKFNIKVLSVENNNSQDLRINEFLTKINFCYFDNVGMDEIYFNKKFFSFY